MEKPLLIGQELASEESGVLSKLVASFNLQELSPEFLTAISFTLQELESEDFGALSKLEASPNLHDEGSTSRF